MGFAHIVLLGTPANQRASGQKQALGRQGACPRSPPRSQVLTLLAGTLVSSPSPPYTHSGVPLDTGAPPELLLFFPGPVLEPSCPTFSHLDAAATVIPAFDGIVTWTLLFKCPIWPQSSPSAFELDQGWGWVAHCLSLPAGVKLRAIPSMPSPALPPVSPPEHADTC